MEFPSFLVNILFCFMWVLSVVFITPGRILFDFIHTVVRLIRWVAFPPDVPVSQISDHPRRTRGYLRFRERIRAWHASKLSLPSLSETSEQLEQRIRRVVPIGTPLAQARQVMERNGFKWDDEPSATFPRDADEGRTTSHSELVVSETGFQCCRKSRTGYLVVPITQDWICAFEYHEGAVARVVARTWFTGP